MTPLQPGPLSPGMVNMLTAGRSVLLHRKHGLAVVRRVYDDHTISYRMLLNDHHGGGDDPGAFTYIGERDDDGWIPAPLGGWGSNPVPGRFIEYRLRNGTVRRGTSDWVARFNMWQHLPHEPDSDIIAFRLVEEATPVGQGSNRKGDLPTVEPQGWVLVPIEPTEAMLRAWYDTQCPPHDTPAGGLTRWATWDEAKVVRADEMRRCYRAMIAAARAKEAGE